MDATPTGEFTQKDVAARVGIEWTNYLRYESLDDAPAPTPGRLKEIADVLDIHPSDLVDLHGKPTLTNHREWSGKTQAEIVAELTARGHKISQGTYSRAENGEAPLPDPIIADLSELIDVDPATIGPFIKPPSLRQLRLWAGLTIDQVEEAVIANGTPDAQTYQDVETGAIPPTPSTVSVLAGLYNADDSTITNAAETS